MTTRPAPPVDVPDASPSSPRRRRHYGWRPNGVITAGERSRRVAGALVVGAALAVGLAACSPTPANLGHGPLGVSQANRNAGGVIRIYDTGFKPGVLRVRAGTNVLVINKGGNSHSVTADDGAFDTGVLAGGGDDASFVLTKPGTYPYYDELDPYEHGVIIVTGG
ncbi:MAG: cupredoxin domain-containing protein [Acidimicrobiales bacterium]